MDWQGCGEKQHHSTPLSPLFKPALQLGDPAVDQHLVTCQVVLAMVLWGP